MKAIKKIISLLVIVAAASGLNDVAAGIIGGIDEINNNVAYSIIRLSSSGNGYLMYDGENDIVKSVTPAPSGDAMLWAIHYSEKEKAYFLYNLAAGKFVKADAANNAVFTTEPVDIVMLPVETLNRWMIDCGGALLGLVGTQSGKALFVDDMTFTSAAVLGCTMIISEETSRQISEEENAVIEEKIAAGKLESLSKYRDFIAQAEILAADKLDNYAGSYNLAELKKAIDAPDDYTIEEIEKIYRNTLLTALPKNGCYYRLKNYSRPLASDMNNVLSLTSEKILKTRTHQNPAVGNGSDSYAEDLCLFRFVSAVDPAVVKIEISALNQFFGGNGNSSRVDIVAGDNAYAYTLQRDNEFSRLFTFADTENKRWLTISGSHELVGYAYAEDPEKWYFEEVREISVNTDANGYAALTLPCGVDIPASCKAYTVTSVNNGKAYVRELDGEIPASTPFILKSHNANSTVKLTVRYITSSVATAMVGTNVRNAKAPARHEIETTADGFRFRKVEAGTVNANSAYLIADTDEPLTVVYGDDPDAGIEEIEADKLTPDTHLFDLQGRPVYRPCPGLYIDAATKKVVRVI